MTEEIKVPDGMVGLSEYINVVPPKPCQSCLCLWVACIKMKF